METTNGVTNDTKKSSVVQTVKLLDQKIGEYRNLQGDGAANYWELGKKVREIYEGELWKLRLDDKGIPKYKTADQFCVAELGMTAPHAYKMMDVAKAYSKEQVKVFGATRLTYMLQLPDEKRAELEDKITKGVTNPSSREVQALAREERVKTGVTTRGGVKKKLPKKGAGRKPAKPREEKITVAALLGMHTVKLFKKPAGRTVDIKDCVRAKKLSDVPWGVLTFENGVEAIISIIESGAGELVAKVAIKRKEE